MIVWDKVFKWEGTVYNKNRYLDYPRVCISVSGICKSLILFYMSGLASLFNGISTLFRLFNAKAILLEEP